MPSTPSNEAAATRRSGTLPSLRTAVVMRQSPYPVRYPPLVATEIAVAGTATDLATPDHATLQVAVTGEGPNRSDAYQAAAEDARAVDEALGTYTEAIETIAHSSFMTHPKYLPRKKQQVAWAASRNSTVMVRDFTSLGELIAALSHSGASVHGPVWAIAVDNPVHRSLRRLAALDARQRAEDYAAALGLEVTAVAWVAEPGLRGAGGYTPIRAMAASGPGPRSPAAGAADPVLEITPPQLPVTAHLEVGFTVG